jgi:hypothetical protein
LGDAISNVWNITREANEFSPEQVEKVGLGVQHAMREFFQNDQISFPAQMLIVSGEVR